MTTDHRPRGHTSPDTYGAPLPDTATAVRHLRFNLAEWRRAATRANREGRGIAEVAGAFLRAYGAGELDAPPPSPGTTPDAARPGPLAKLGAIVQSTTTPTPTPKGDA